MQRRGSENAAVEEKVCDERYATGVEFCNGNAMAEQAYIKGSRLLCNRTGASAFRGMWGSFASESGMSFQTPPPPPPIGFIFVFCCSPSLSAFVVAALFLCFGIS